MVVVVILVEAVDGDIVVKVEGTKVVEVESCIAIVVLVWESMNLIPGGDSAKSKLEAGLKTILKLVVPGKKLAEYAPLRKAEHVRQ